MYLFPKILVLHLRVEILPGYPWKCSRICSIYDFLLLKKKGRGREKKFCAYCNRYLWTSEDDGVILSRWCCECLQSQICSVLSYPLDPSLLESVYLHFLWPALARVLAYWACLACKLHCCSPPVELVSLSMWFLSSPFMSRGWPFFLLTSVTWKHSISLLISSLTT